MDQAALDSISLRLLRLFEIVYRTRSISRAAEELSTTQPSVSLTLGRLRMQLGDPLFVRVGSRMEPTARADELIQGVRMILAIATDRFLGSAAFDPVTSERTFTLHMTDPAETILLPLLVEAIARTAPQVHLRVRDVGEDSQALLAEGRVDLALGHLANVATDLYQQKLHDEHYVCVARAAHPRVQDGLTLEQFSSESHVVVAIAGTGHVHEPGFGRLKIAARIALEVSSYLAIGPVILRTDLIAVVPSRLASRLAAHDDIASFKLPLESPVFQVRQYWHPRSHRDPGNSWLRSSLAELI